MLLCSVRFSPFLQNLDSMFQRLTLELLTVDLPSVWCRCKLVWMAVKLQVQSTLRMSFSARMSGTTALVIDLIFNKWKLSELLEMPLRKSENSTALSDSVHTLLSNWQWRAVEQVKLRRPHCISCVAVFSDALFACFHFQIVSFDQKVWFITLKFCHT